MIKQINSSFLHCFLFSFISFHLVSCSIVDKSTFHHKQIAEYAELLFMRQNTVTQQVMMLFDEELSGQDEEQISKAELQMHDACHLLNEYANREIEGKSMSVFFRRKVKLSLEQCEERVRNMEWVLTRIDKNSEQ